MDRLPTTSLAKAARHALRIALTATAIASMVIMPTWRGALANPSGAEVVRGQAGMVSSGSTLTVTNSPGAIIHWQDFSIASGELTRFVQQSPDSAVLNRVVGPNLSALQGVLHSNGRVFLINPNGIAVGEGAVIDTAGFVASTLAMSDEDFISGRMAFGDGGDAGSLQNAGLIVAHHDDIMLVAPRIENSGVIQADNGDVLLAAGRKVLVADISLPGVAFEIQAPDDAVLNLGDILAQGSAAAFAGTITQQGMVQADTVEVGANGEIILRASGDLDVGPGSFTLGGDVHIESGATTWVQGTVRGEAVDILGPQAGLGYAAAVSGERVHLGGSRQGAGPLPNSRAVYTHPKSRIEAVDEVVVWGDEVANVHGDILAPGGFVETSSAGILSITTSPDVSDGGEWLLDPPELTIDGATADTSQSGSTFTADAAESVISVGTVTGALTGNSTVTLVTTGLGTGDILLATMLDLADTSGSNTLVFQSAGDTLIANPIGNSSTGSQQLDLRFETAGRAVVSADIDLGGGTLVAANGLTGTSGWLDFAGDANVSAASISAAKLSVSSGTAILDGPSSVDELAITDGVLGSRGDIDVASLIDFGDGDLRLGDAVVLTLAAGGAWMHTGDGDIGRLDELGIGRVVNNGSLTRSVDTGTAFIDATYDGTGLVDVQTGRLIFNQGGSLSGTVSVAEGARVGFAGTDGTPFTLTATSMLSGLGSVEIGSFNAGAVQIDGTLALPNLTVDGGTTQISTSAAALRNLVAREGRLQMLDTTALTLDKLEIFDGAVTLSGPASAIDFFQDDGQLILFDDLTITGSAVWSGGEQGGPGATIIDAMAVLDIPPGPGFDPTAPPDPQTPFPPHLGPSHTLINRGTTNLDGNALAMDNAAIVNEGIFNVLNGGGITAVIQFVGEGGSGNPGSFTSPGTLNASGSGNVIETPLTVSGDINISGDFTISGGGELSGPINLDPNATLAFGRPDFFFPNTTLLDTASVNGGTIQVLQGNVNVQTATISVSEIHVDSGSFNLESNAPFSVPTLRLTQSGVFRHNGPVMVDDLIQERFSTLGTTGVGPIGDFTIANSWQYSGGNQQGAANTVLAAGATLTIDTIDTKRIDSGRNLILDGDATLTGNGNIFLGSGSRIEINGAWAHDAPAGIFQSFFNATGSVDVNGTFSVAPALSTVSVSAAFNNNAGGVVDVGSSLVLSGNGSHAGTFNVAAGTDLGVGSNGRTNTFLPGSQIIGQGSLTLNGGTNDFQDSMGLDTLRVNGGSNTFSGDVSALRSINQISGTLSIPNTSLTLDGLVITGGSATFGQNLVVTDLTQQFSNTLAGADISITNSWTWQGGQHTGAGTTTLEAGATLNVSGFSSFTLSGGRSVQLNGDTAWNSFATLTFQGATLVNSGTWTQSSALQVVGTDPTDEFINDGTFNHLANFATSSIDVKFTNSPTPGTGVVNIQNNSTLRLRGGASLDGMIVVDAGSTLDLGDAQELALYTIEATGAVSGPGALTSSDLLQIDGTLSASRLDVLDGTTTFNTPAGVSDVLVQGSATLAFADPTPFSLTTLDVMGGSVTFAPGSQLTVTDASFDDGAVIGAAPPNGSLVRVSNSANLFGRVVINTDLDLDLASALVIDGSPLTPASVTFGAAVTAQGGATISLAGQGVTNVRLVGGLTANGATITTQGSGLDPTTFFLTGPIALDATTVDVQDPTIFDTFGGDLTLRNGSAINVAAVTAYVDGRLNGNLDVDASSSLDVAANGSLLVLDATFIDGGATLSGLGTFDPAFTGFTSINPDAVTAIIRDTNLLQGPLVLNPGARVEVFGSTLTLGAGASISNGSALVINDAANLIALGAIDNAGLLENRSDGASIAIGSGSQSGVFQTDGVSEFAFGSGVTFNDGTKFALSPFSDPAQGPATFRWNGVTVTAGGIVTVEANAFVDVQADIGDSGQINVAGLLQESSSPNFAGTIRILSGGDLDIPTAFSVDTVTLDGGLISGSGTLTANSQVTWNAGTMTGGGTLTNLGVMDINGFSIHQLDNFALINAGTVNVNAPGTIVLANGATIDNDGTWNQIANTFYQNLNFNTQATFNNNSAGTFTQTATGQTTFDVVVNNAGTMDVQAGNLQLRSGGSHDGAFMVAAGSDLVLGTNGLSATTLNAASSVTGAGSLTLSQNSSLLSGTFTLPSLTLTSNGFRTIASDLSSLDTLQVFGGSNTLTNAAPLTLTTYNQTSGTISLAGDMTVANFSQSSNSTLNSDFAIDVTSAATWSGGTQSGAGTTTVQSGATLTLSGFNQKVLTGGRQLIVAGDTTVSGSGSIRIDPGSLLTNGGAWDQQVGTGYFGGGQFTNNGSFTQSSPFSGTLLTNVIFVNDGSVDVQSSSLTLADIGASTGTFVVAAGARLRTFGTTFGPSTSLSGGGVLSADSGTTTVQGSFGLPGAEAGFGDTLAFETDASSLRQLAVFGGDVQFPGQIALTLDDLEVNNRMFNAPGDLTVTNLTLDSDGAISSTFDTTVTGTFDWRGGGFTGPGTTTLQAGAMVNATGFDSLFLGGGHTLVLNGTVQSSDNVDALRLNASTLINNGTWTHDGGGLLVIGDADAALVNNGTMVFQGAAPPGQGFFEERTIGIRFDNHGTVQILDGNLQLTAGGLSSGTYDVAAGAELRFDVDDRPGAPLILVPESGDVRLGAFTLDPAAFNLIGDSDIFNSTIIPHVSVLGFLGDGALGGDDVDWYRFSGLAGQTVDLDIDTASAGLTEEDIDTILSLFDADGTLLAFDDDSNNDPGSSTDLDSFLGTFMLPADGDYFIAVSAFSNFPTAAFQSGSRTDLTRPDGAFGGESVAAAAFADDSFEADTSPDQGSSFDDYRLNVSLTTQVMIAPPLDLDVPVFQFTSTSRITGAGRTVFDGSVTDLASSQLDVANADIDGGKVNFNANNSVSSAVSIHDGFVAVGGDTQFSSTIDQQDGFISGAGTITNAGTHTLSGMAGANLDYVNEANLAVNATPENPGTDVSFDSVLNTSTGTLTVENLDPNNANPINVTFSSNTLINQGTVQVLPGQASTPASVNIFGRIVNDGGTFVLQAPTTFATGGGNFEIAPNAAVQVVDNVPVNLDLGGGNLVFAGNIDLGDGAAFTSTNGIFQDEGGTVSGPGAANFTPPDGVFVPPEPPTTEPEPPATGETPLDLIREVEDPSANPITQQDQQLAELADQQTDLEGCNNDDIDDPDAVTEGEHGVGCR